MRGSERKSLAVVGGLIAAGFFAAVCLVHWGRRAQGSALLEVQRPQDSLWMQGYLLSNPDYYNMNEDIQGLSNTTPFRNQMTFGPVVHKTKVLSKLRGFPQQRILARNLPAQHPTQVLCGLGSGCEYENDNNVIQAESHDPEAVNKDMPNPVVSDDVVKEIQDAIADYRKDMQVEKRLNAGDPENNFKQVKGAKKLKQARLQSLCGYDSGCEDENRQALERAEEVDAQTVNVDMPEFPGDDTIDEVWKAIEDKKRFDEKADEHMRGEKAITH